jgi:hypothetical protein
MLIILFFDEVALRSLCRAGRAGGLAASGAGIAHENGGGAA